MRFKISLRFKDSDLLLARMREGGELTRFEMLRLIVGLSIPSVLAQITSVLMFYIDAAMVGHLGASASASIGLVESATWLFGSILNVASAGFAVQIAHRVGARDFSGARSVFRTGLMSTALVGVVMCALAAAIAYPLPRLLGGGPDIVGQASVYFLIFAFALPFLQLSYISSGALKSSGNMTFPGAVSILMCVLDVCFNYLYIYIFGLGVAGAALGTFTAVVIVALLSFYYAVTRCPILSLRGRSEVFRFSRSAVRKALTISSPLALQQIFMGGAQIISTIIVAPLGNIAIAANTFAITVESLCYMPGYGIGDAAQTLTGQSLGAGRAALCRSFARRTVGLGMIVMAAMGALMYIFAPEMLGLITPDAGIRALGTGALRIEAFAEPMFAASIVTASICIGAGDTRTPTLINLSTMWGVRLTLATLLAPHYGLRGVWFAMALELSLRGAVYLIHLFRGKWISRYEALNRKPRQA